MLIRAKCKPPSVTFSHRSAVVSEHGQVYCGRVVLLLRTTGPGHCHASQHVSQSSRGSRRCEIACRQVDGGVLSMSHGQACRLLACRRKSRSARSLDCSGMGWALTGRLGPLGLPLQVIIISKKCCSDRVPALLYALTQIGRAPAGLGRCSVQSANERLHTPSGVALTDVFSFSQEPPMLAPNHSRSTGTILIQLKTSVPAVKSPVSLDCVSDLSPTDLQISPKPSTVRSSPALASSLNRSAASPPAK